MRIDSLFEAQTPKMTPCSREKQKLRMTRTAQLSIVSVTLEVASSIEFDFSFRWHICTGIFADTI